MKHSDKIKLARRLITKQELALGVSLFNSRAWNNRKNWKREKALRREDIKRVHSIRRAKPVEVVEYKHDDRPVAEVKSL